MAQQINPATLERMKAVTQSGNVSDKQRKILGELVKGGLVNQKDFMVPEGTQPALGPTEMLGAGAKTFAGGAVKGAGFLTSGFEAAGDLINRNLPRPPGMSPPSPTDLGGTMTKFGQEMIPERGDLPFGERATLAGAELAGEALAFQGPLTALGFVRKAGLAPAAMRKLRGFERYLVDLARDPIKMNTAEQALAMVAGGGGEQAAEMFGESSRFVGELTSAIGASGFALLLKNIGSMIGNRFMMRKADARDVIGRVIKEEFDANPQLEQNLIAALKDEAQFPGVQLSTAQATRSPVFQEAGSRLQFNAADQANRNRKAVQDYSEGLDSAMTQRDTEKFQVTLRGAVDDGVGRIDSELNKLQSDLTSTLAAGGDQKTLGIDARDIFENIKNTAREEVNTLYGRVGDLKLPPESLKTITDSLSKAAKTASPSTKLPSEVSEVIAQIAPAFQVKQGRQRAGFTSAPRQKSKPESRLAVVTEKLKIVNDALRTVEVGTDAERRLTIIRDGFNRTLDDLADNATITSPKLSILKEARRQRREFGQRFQQHTPSIVSAQTNQGGPRVSDADFLGKFIKTDKQIGSQQSAESFVDIFGTPAASGRGKVLGPDARKMIETDFSTKLRAYASDAEGNLNPKKMREYIAKHKTVLKTLGLQGQFANNAKAIRTIESNMDEWGAAKGALEKSSLAKFADADDPIAFIQTLLNQPGKLKEFTKNVNGSKNVSVIKGFRRSLAEVVLDRAVQPISDIALPGASVFTPKLLDTTLIKNEAILRQSLGKKHYDQLTSLSRMLQRMENPATTGAELPRDLKEVQNLTFPRVLSLVRQVQQRILSPQFVAIEATARGIGAFQSGMRREMMLEALADPKFAQELANAARTNEGRALLFSVWRPTAVAGSITADTREDVAGEGSPAFGDAPISGDMLRQMFPSQQDRANASGGQQVQPVEQP